MKTDLNSAHLEFLRIESIVACSRWPLWCTFSMDKFGPIWTEPLGISQSDKLFGFQMTNEDSVETAFQWPICTFELRSSRSISIPSRIKTSSFINESIQTNDRLLTKITVYETGKNSESDTTSKSLARICVFENRRSWWIWKMEIFTF